MKMHAFYVKNLRTGKYHAGASYGGRWSDRMAQLFTRRRDVDSRVGDLVRRQGYAIPDPDNPHGSDLKVCEVDIELE